MLLVDDLEFVRSSLRLLLETYEWIEVVAEAGSGPEALALCSAFSPDLVLLDLMMPNMNGAITALVAPEFPSLCIVLLTASLEDELIDEALAAGVQGYLPKAEGDQIIDALYHVYQARS